ncbi:MAG TPA: helix-turn-helix transcriptional regulator [Clostridiales bacterium]|nr:helix-turn-helix transcriptional regulator [Clostridiales bacterium]
MIDSRYVIHKSYRDNALLRASFHALAKETFGISRSHLSREFKKITGFSPKEYLIQIRISQAKLLLRGSSISIDDISSAIGFHDTAHFIQTFKKAEGITPLKFRKF